MTPRAINYIHEKIYNKEYIDALETDIRDDISDEVTARTNADVSINGRIDVEEQTRGNADTALDTRVTTIEDVIPSEASTSNKLADKAFVNSSVQTATANFRGNWLTWSAVPTDVSQYPEDYAGSRTPTVNDYLAIQDASGFAEGYEGTWRFKYVGKWETLGKNGWVPEYQINETPLTAEQLAALNSGITLNKVSEYNGYDARITTADNNASTALATANAANTAVAGKQDTLNSTQLAAVNSGITSTKVGYIRKINVTASDPGAESTLASGEITLVY